MSNFISIANQSLTVAQMFASPPEGLERVGLYLNEVKEVAGVPRFMEWLKFFGNFGLTDKQRQKLQRAAKEAA